MCVNMEYENDMCEGEDVNIYACVKADRVRMCVKTRECVRRWNT